MKDPKGPTKAYKSPEEIAKKHKVSLSHIMDQLKVGIKVEKEHTTSNSQARIVALQHLDEIPDYYTRLKKMEKSKVSESLDNNRKLLSGERYCLLCNKMEREMDCSWGPNMWRKYSIATVHPANEEYLGEKKGLWDNIHAKRKRGERPAKPGEKGYPKTLDVNEDHKEIASGKKKDDEGYMANIEFDQIERSINILRRLIRKGDQQLPAWVQSKITRAADFVDTAAEYLSSDENIKEQKTFDEFLIEVAAWQRKEGKNQSGGLNEKGRKSYERENPGSDLKAPSKKVGNPRRASFCARMSGMKKKLTSKKTANDPNSRINKSLRAWNC